MMIRSFALLSLFSLQALAQFDWGKIDQLLCLELQKGADKKSAAVNVCKEVTKSLPFLQGQCETLVSKTMSALEKKCAAILPTATTTTKLPAVSVLGDQLVSLFHGKFADVQLDKIASSTMELVPTDIKEAAQKAGLAVPTPQEIMCKGMTDTLMENRTEQAVCQSLLPDVHNDATEACYKAVGFIWGQEAASLKCPGAPEPWWPFAILHGFADKLICVQFKIGDLHEKKQEITGKICNTISQGSLDRFTCEVAVKQFFEGYEKKCADMENEEPAMKLMPKGSDILV
mmetsp:Transcript_146418/g.272664  ORF Transcript_146418/g.272664 Transcript_146418/m.272664 type:complete len:287 (+) Transcript_146418:120-980(+)